MLYEVITGAEKVIAIDIQRPAAYKHEIDGVKALGGGGRPASACEIKASPWPIRRAFVRSSTPARTKPGLISAQPFRSNLKPAASNRLMSPPP